jgi:curved DNA-binding protein CbpA
MIDKFFNCYFYFSLYQGTVFLRHSNRNYNLRVQANYYYILNVKRTASGPEIKAAYKRLAILYHPDKHQGNTYFEEQFKQVNAAYQILSNPQKRALYDSRLDYLAQQQRAQQQQKAYYGQQRRPASVRERHYYNIPKKRKISRRDIQITVGLILIVVLGALLLNLIMDSVTAKHRFRDAKALMQEKEWSGAHSLLSEAISFEPEFADAYQMRGGINQDIYQNYNDAIMDYTAALEFGEKPVAKTYFQRGICYYLLKDYLKAERDFTLAIKTDKNFRMPYFKRGELRLLELSNWAGATADLSVYLQKPAQTDKNKALLYRGFAFYLQDKYAQAVQDYQAALATDTRNGRLYYLLGKAEMAQEKPTDACNHFMYAYTIGYSPALTDWQELCGRR